jgi:Sec-independent protein secretion pathway component TatC
MRRRIRESFLPAALGLLVFMAACSFGGVLLVMLSADLETPSAAAWLRGSLMMFIEGLFWAFLIGAPFAWPAALLLAAVPECRASAAAAALAVFSLLAMWVLHLGVRALDAPVVAASVWLGARASLRRLQRRREALAVAAHGGAEDGEL